MTKNFFCFIIFILFISSVYTQNLQRDTIEYKYPTEILITATRMSLSLKEIPFSASIVDREILTSLPRSVAVDEAMKLVPGVKVDNQANGNRLHLSIRGQGILTERGIRGIKILLDEIPVNDPTGFAPDFFDVDLNNVDRIEVLRGAAASLYGGSAAGGIINIITQNSPNVPLFGEASMSIGSNNFWKAFGQFGGNVKDINYRISLSRTMGDGYRAHTHFWGNNINAKVTYTPSSFIQLTPIFNWTNFYHENPEGINLDYYLRDPKLPNDDAIPFNEYLETNRITNGMKGLIMIEKNHEIRFNGYVKRTLFTEANNRTFNHRTILTPGTSIQYTFSIGDFYDFIKNKVSVGADLQWQTIDEYRVDNLHSLEGDTLRSREQIKQRGVGLFLIDKIDIGKNLGFMLNLRYDKIGNKLKDLLKNPYDLSGDANFSKTTARIGVTYQLVEKVNLFANWGQGFLPPATEELAQNPDQFGGFNTHLTYATSNGLDLGARGNLLDNLFYDVTLFYLNTNNDFDRYRITNPLRTQETFYRNAGSSKRWGLELYSRYQPINSINIQLAYTYSDFKYTNSEPIQIMMDDPSIQKFIVSGNFLPNSPKHQLYCDISYLVTPSLCISMSSETISKTYIDGANIESEAADGYTLLHIRVTYSYKVAGISGEISFSGRNLSDQKYVAFTEPDPGGNAYQPGSGREFFGNIKIKL